MSELSNRERMQQLANDEGAWDSRNAEALSDLGNIDAVSWFRTDGWDKDPQSAAQNSLGSSDSYKVSYQNEDKQATGDWKKADFPTYQLIAGQQDQQGRIQFGRLQADMDVVMRRTPIPGRIKGAKEERFVLQRFDAYSKLKGDMMGTEAMSALTTWKEFFYDGKGRIICTREVVGMPPANTFRDRSEHETFLRKLNEAGVQAPHPIVKKVTHYDYAKNPPYITKTVIDLKSTNEGFTGQLSQYYDPTFRFTYSLSSTLLSKDKEAQLHALHGVETRPPDRFTSIKEMIAKIFK